MTSTKGIKKGMQLHCLIKISLDDCLTLCYLGYANTVCPTLVISELKHRMAVKVGTL